MCAGTLPGMSAQKITVHVDRELLSRGGKRHSQRTHGDKRQPRELRSQ
jgi:hypothetical protein